MYVEFSLKPVYPTMGVENLIAVVQITRKCICESKNWIYIFLLMSPYKTLPQVHNIIPPGRSKLLIPQAALFFQKSTSIQHKLGGG